MSAKSTPGPDAHVVADQSEVVAFLDNPATHGSTLPVTRVETHGGRVFLCGDSALKIKRAVRYPFMDFSTLDKRRRACEREIEINRPNAPDIYIDAVPVVRAPPGLRLGGDGEIVEWVVRMRRFDENNTLDRVAARGGVDRRLAVELARVVARAHQRAPRSDFDAAAALASNIDENAASFSEFPSIFSPDDVRRMSDAARARLRDCRALLDERRRAGFVRRCHGDLHLGNIALRDGAPVLFDALEFDEALATCDVLYDLAFLAMDLWEKGVCGAANAVCNSYLDRADSAQFVGLAAFRLFLSARAAIRAKVVAARARGALDDVARDGMIRDAKRYFALAEEFLRPSSPALIAVGGLSGSGKSSVAAELAPLFGAAPGCVVARSDVERKRLFSVAPETRLEASAYGADTTMKVYAAARRHADLALAAGFSVIADAVHATRAEREAIEAIARGRGVPFFGLWLDAPTDQRARRVQSRVGDASDADAGIARLQADYDVSDIDWRRVDATGDVETVVARAIAALDIRPRRVGG